MERIAQTYPDEATLGFFGESRNGRRMPFLVISRGKKEGRKAILLTASLHANELTGGNLLLSCAEEWIKRVGSNAEQSLCLYVLPRIAIDGAEYVISTRSVVRSRETISNGAQIIRRDLDGNGLVLQMRWPDEKGDFFVPEEDPRIVLPFEGSCGAGRRYHQVCEGVLGEDVAKGITPDEPPYFPDFNRDFATKGKTSEAFTEPEVCALRDFVIAHPDIKAALDLHSGNPAVFYPDSWVGMENWEQSPGYRIGTKLEEAFKAPLVSSYSEIRTGVPQKKGPGYFIHWLNERFGIPAYILEVGLYYNSFGIAYGEFEDNAALCLQSTRRLLSEAGGFGGDPVFHAWKPFHHRQFGLVEIGGWDGLLYRNPPFEDWPALAERTMSSIGVMVEYLSDHE